MEGERATQASLVSYVAGFVLSLVLTLVAYTLVAQHASTNGFLVGAVVVLAIAQFIVQLVFFLHLAREPKPRANLMVFGFMALVLVILVFGSLWIMSNLDYHMSPHDAETELLHEEGISK